jgi:O-antigen/teichoic acid export membrane protein
MVEDIKEKATSSIIWSTVEKFSVQGLGFIITLIVARLVSPSDYGLIAMLGIFMAVSQIFIDCGFSNSLIQNKQRTELDYSTVFYINLAVGVACYLILFFAAPYIASFYAQPELSLILKIYGLTLIVSSLTLVQRARLYIRFEYKKLSAISIVTIIVGGVTAIVMAYRGWGVWALVAYYLVQAGVSSLLIWVTSGWMPRRVFSKASARHAFNFGSKLLVANLLNTIVSNLYTLIIGKQYSAKDLGYYSRGQSISYLVPSQLSNMLNQAVYPVLCELQSEPLRLKEMFSNYIRYSALICFPVMTFLVALSEPLVSVLLTDKWLPSVPFIQILAIGYALDPIMRLNAIALSVTGKTKLCLQSEVVKKVLLLVVLFATLPFGLTWLTIGVAVYSLLDIISVSFFTRQVIPIHFLEQVRLFIPYVGYSVLMYLSIRMAITATENQYLQLCLGVLAGSIVYAVLLRLFSKNRVIKMVRVLKKLD